MPKESFVGREYPVCNWEVEQGKIKELVKAIGDKNPVYVDKSSAVAEGYADIVAPPTYITVPIHWMSIYLKIIEDMSINFKNVLHGEESYTYFQEIYPGDNLTGRLKIIDVAEKKGKNGPLNIVTIETLYKNQRNEVVIKVKTIFIERK